MAFLQTHDPGLKVLKHLEAWYSPLPRGLITQQVGRMTGLSCPGELTGLQATRPGVQAPFTCPPGI